MIDSRRRHGTQDSVRHIRGAGNLQEVTSGRITHNETPYPIGRPPTPALMSGSIPERYPHRVLLRVARQKVRVVTVGAYRWPPPAGIFAHRDAPHYVIQEFVNRADCAAVALVKPEAGADYHDVDPATSSYRSRSNGTSSRVFNVSRVLARRLYHSRSLRPIRPRPWSRAR